MLRKIDGLDYGKASQEETHHDLKRLNTQVKLKLYLTVPHADVILITACGIVPHSLLFNNYTTKAVHFDVFM